MSTEEMKRDREKGRDKEKETESGKIVRIREQEVEE